MSRAGYADFFPTAPSVLARKAKDERLARWKSTQQAKQLQQTIDEDHQSIHAKDAPSSETATSTSTVASNASYTTLTPATSNSSPPAHASPDKQSEPEHNAKPEVPAPVLLTPKATPPAVSTPPARKRRNCRITFDPVLEKDKIPELGKYPIYRWDGEGITTPIEDPRKQIPDYGAAAKNGKKQQRDVLGRVQWAWDANYIGPGPPSQILITGLSPLTMEPEISMHFRTFGEIKSLTMKYDPATGGSLGVCSILYRDSKSLRLLGHQAAKEAVARGNGLNIGMQRIRVTLDRDGLKCAKVVEGILHAKQRKEDEEARKREEERLSKERASRSYGSSDMNGMRRDRSPIRDHDSRFSKPRPANYVAYNELGSRPAVFISARNVPGGEKMVRHMYGRLRNFGLDEILTDICGFFVVFNDLHGMERCYNLCNGDHLFSHRMWMKPYPTGNTGKKTISQSQRRARSRSRSRSPQRSRQKLNPVTLATTSIIRELKVTVLKDIRKRVADAEIYDLLDPVVLAKRRKLDTPTVTISPAKPAMDTIDDPTTETKPIYANLAALPRFKRRVRKAETPLSDASPMPGSHRRKSSIDDARPLMHRLNQYDADASDDDSGIGSRGMSTEPGDDEVSISTEQRLKKRKRNMGGRTPSRLKGSVLSDEEGEPVDINKEMEDFIADSDEEMQVSRKRPKKSKKPKRAEEIIFTPSASEDETVEPDVKRKGEVVPDEDEHIDMSMDVDEEIPDVMEAILQEEKKAGRDAELLTPTDVDLDNEPSASVTLRLPEKTELPEWALSTPEHQQPTIYDDPTIILDLDGLQDLVKDDEDFDFLRAALASAQKGDIGNPHAFACRIKEIKAANMEGEPGLIRKKPKIEGFYRPNPTGCARTEGYRRIPEAEKSMYLPHRLAVAAKRADMAKNKDSNHAAPINTTKPVSSSRSNRVNNRRLVAELNNQKQILSGDADIVRFNQLKKRKKPVKFARSAIHNWGLYAMENIAANDMIIEYVGEKVRQQVADLRERKYLKSGIGSSYLFRIDENTVIDATKHGGIARFINHSCTPNCTAKIIKVEGSKRIVIYALRDIAENEELTYDYKFERELDSEERIPCLCGSSGCKGFLN
ncbi:histone H3-K4 methyltransferase Set1 [Ascodesmis nigricans]|uniref:Histone-lysine N-methyltransferase, H3 lysine-4 specific n=1 Tax=Ascodesmis nigricans TaxID=341454 RepID=A0A4S2MMN6_9PEZI|nr:histone H3-K4 methyltransferase Set1 [Ascodesmis nigricans]